MSSSVEAGSFGEWLAAMRAVLRGERAADVPCGDCVGCCVSSYPIPLRPADKLARAEVPEQMLMGPAEAGKDWLMGFREDGSCPFLACRCCSIYPHRPQTCRDYDCRIYAAAELMPDGHRPVIADRVRAWRFELRTAEEAAAAAAVSRAARFIRENAALFPPGMRAGSATAAAVTAVKVYPRFLEESPARTAIQMAQLVVESARAFDSGAV